MIVLAGTASGQWSTNPAVNNIICNLTGEQAIPKVAVCPNGDIYIAYFSNDAGNYDVRLQRLDSQGNIQWASNGILISGNPQETWLTDWDMTADPSNHCILTFNDIRNGNTNVYGYRISPSGSFVWGPNGIALSNNSSFNAAPKVIATSAGNVVCAWMSDAVIIMQKVSPTGTLQWGPSGITLSSVNTLSWPQIIPVGTDDFYMKYYDDSGPGWSPTRHVFLKRFNASGAAVWASPATISTAGGISAQTQILPFIKDDNDGVYIAWDDDRDNNMFASSFVQHVNSAGQVLFAANGVEVCTTPGMNHWYPQMAQPTGSTDVFVFWNEINGNQNQWGMYGQKISSSGARMWTDAGMVFLPVSSTDIYPMALKKTPTDIVLFYEEYLNGINTQLKAMRINTTGGYVWTPVQTMICSVNSQKIHTEISDLANDQWILTWEDTRSGTSDIYAQNLALAGTLGPVSSGTITGTITLNGGVGNVTQALVQAGSATTHPDATGFYSLNVPTGTYTVTATLAGYTPASQSGVNVLTNQTTPNINLTLTPVPIGYIDGTVTLLNGSGIVTMVTVQAGSVTTHPDATGHYQLAITPGTYTVTATLTAYIPGSVSGVVVTNNQTTSGINFALSLAPTSGFIEGTVTLNGGSGDVTQTIVSAGGNFTSPNASGYYTMELPIGNYDVMASLTGYGSQFNVGVAVIGGQTTSNVNFTLVPLANIGYITGHVSIQDGFINLTEVVVNAGTYNAHPDASGNYSIEVPVGTYDVVASHPYTTSQTVSGVSVLAQQTTYNINFTLEVIRADLVVKAMDQYNAPIYPVAVNIAGPEGTLTGTITGDSIVFPAVLFGSYSGTGTWEQMVVTADTVVGSGNNHLDFLFIIGGIQSRQNIYQLKVMPNPANQNSIVTFNLAASEAITMELIGTTGQRIVLLSAKKMAAGNYRATISDLTKNTKLSPGVYSLIISGAKHSANCKIVITL